MPKVDYNLSTQRVDTGGQSPGLRPVLFNGAASAQNLRAPQINPNAANVEFTPVTPPRVGIADPLAVGIASAGILFDTWNKAAADYRDKQDAMAATLAVEQAQEATDAIINGRTNPDGSFSPGYTSAKMKQATDFYPFAVGEVDKQHAQIMASLDPNVRAKAAAKMLDIRRQAMNTIGKHRLSEEEAFGKRDYESTGNHEVKMLADEMFLALKPVLGDFTSLPVEEQRKAIQPFLDKAEAEVTRRSQNIQYAPPTADPANDTYVDVIRYLYTQPDGGNLVADALMPMMSDYITSADGREKVYKAMGDYYKQSLERRAYKLKVEEIGEKEITKAQSSWFYTNAAKAAQGGPAEQFEFINQAQSIGGDTGVEQANRLLNIHKNADPINIKELELINTTLQKGNSIPALLQDIKDGKVSMSGAGFKKLQELDRIKMDELIVEKQKRAEDGISAILADMKEAKENPFFVQNVEQMMATPRGHQIKEGIKGRMTDFLMDQVRQGKSRYELSEAADKFMAAELKSSIEIDLRALGDVDPKNSNIPQNLQLINAPGLEKLKTASTPFEGLSAMKTRLNSEYVKDSRDLKAALELTRDETRLAKLNAWYMKSVQDGTNTDKINEVKRLFNNIYTEVQKQYFLDNGVTPATLPIKMSEIGTFIQGFNNTFDSARDNAKVVDEAPSAGDK